jgi:hypothetical protein
MQSGQGTSGDKSRAGVAEWAGREGKSACLGASGLTRGAGTIRYNRGFPIGRY